MTYPKSLVLPVSLSFPFLHLNLVRITIVNIKSLLLASLCGVWSLHNAIAADPNAEPATATAPADAVAEPEAWNIHGQLTNTTQWHPAFHSPYRGQNSLDGSNRSTETTDVTLFAGVRLWSGAAVYLNPEFDQGFGFSRTWGVAGFPSGESYRVGSDVPHGRLHRLFLRQVFGLSDATQAVASGANQLADNVPTDNVTLTVGKFSVVDIFDNNGYAHDPRADFLNWSVLSAGAFDYAGDSWGYTYGAALEWTQDWWTLRGGYFDLVATPGVPKLNHLKRHEFVGEWEMRGQLLNHPGKLKLLGFVNYGNMGDYTDAVRLAQLTGAGTAPDTTQVRRIAANTGYSINIEQELSAELGFFARASRNNGNKESLDFTDINRSLTMGLSLKGDRWNRHDDTLGVAVVVNSLSSAARAYFAAGGMGDIIGDGRLNYRPERIVETYYSWHIDKRLTLSADYQYIGNPGYNQDRGPASIFGLRLHAEY